MRVLVCGGRNFIDVPRLWLKLDQIDSAMTITVIIDGASDDVTGPYQGADYWGHWWAIAHSRETIRQHADWKQYGKSAGPRRNGVMLKEHKPDMLVATDGGRGTDNMISQAMAAGVPVERC
jgi:hypothetical protein